MLNNQYNVQVDDNDRGIVISIEEYYISEDDE